MYPWIPVARLDRKTSSLHGHIWVYTYMYMQIICMYVHVFITHSDQRLWKHDIFPDQKRQCCSCKHDEAPVKCTLQNICACGYVYVCMHKKKTHAHTWRTDWQCMWIWMWIGRITSAWMSSVLSHKSKTNVALCAGVWHLCDECDTICTWGW